MNKQQIIDLFNNYPQVDTFFATSDGLAFQKESDANNYAREKLTNKNITVLKRGVDNLEVKSGKTAGTAPKTGKVTVTQEMLDMNPDLAAEGVQVGEEIEYEEAAPEELPKDPKPASKKASSKKAAAESKEAEAGE